MMPPTYVKIRIEERGKKKFGISLPVFLLWPFGFAFGILLMPFVLFGAVMRAGPVRGPQAAFALYEMVCALKGLIIDVDNPKEKVQIVIS